MMVWVACTAADPEAQPSSGVDANGRAAEGRLVLGGTIAEVPSAIEFVMQLDTAHRAIGAVARVLIGPDVVVLDAAGTPTERDVIRRGRRVRARAAGPIMESHPIQVWADTVWVERPVGNR